MARLPTSGSARAAVAALALLTACASPGAVWEGADPGPAPSHVTYDAGALAVLPPQTTDDALTARALGVHALLETTLAVHPDVVLRRLSALDAFPDPGAFDDWRAAAAAVPAALLDRGPRWLLLARLRPDDALTLLGAARPAIHLRLLDRQDGRAFDAHVPLDAPHWQALRFATLNLLERAELTPPEQQRGVMTWTETLPLPALDALGRDRLAALRAPHGRRPTPGPSLPPGAAHSYAAHVLTTQLLPDCAAAGPLLTRAILLNPLGLDAHEALGHCGVRPSAALARLLRTPDVGCGVAGKSLMGSIGTRTVAGSGVLAGVGGFYAGLACRHESLEAAEMARDKAADAWERSHALRTLGLARQQLGDLANARAALEDAVAAAREVAWPPLLAETLLRLGDLHHQASRHDDALATLDAALAAATTDPHMTARVHNSAGLVHQARGVYDLALTAFAEAATRFRALDDRANIGVVLANVGITWTLLGEHDRAVAALDEALVLKRATRSVGGEIVLLADLGAAWLAAGHPDRAAPYLVDAAGRATDLVTLATIHNNLGQVHRAAGRDGDARTAFQAALEAAERARVRPIAGTALHNLASLSAAEGDLEAAAELYRQALRVRRLAGDVSGQGLTLNDLMHLAARRGEPRLAILWGKLSVAAHQRVRDAARGINAEADRAFVRTRLGTYRQLADLLIAQGRLYEAEATLALLKGDEYATWARRGDAAAADLPLTATERAANERFEDLGDSALALAREYDELARKTSLTGAERERLHALESEIAAANARFNAWLAGLSDALGVDRPAERLRQELAVGPLLGKLGPGVAAVYTLVTDDRYRAIVVTAEGQVAVEKPIALASLNRLIADFRAALQDPDVDPRPLARQLHDVLFVPIAPHVQAAGAHTLMWSLDRTLRYVPVNALFDGERWLIERYASALFSPVVREWLAEPPGEDWRVMAFGTTRRWPGFAALPGVARELSGIVAAATGKGGAGTLPGESFLDARFTREALMDGLRSRPPVVHIATHFRFQPGDDRASFLLLGDGTQLAVADIAALPNVFRDVELLTLSACSTAVGDIDARDGREVESFAVLAQEKGARAVFASLWPVVDESTSVLMRLFYRIHAREPALSKLEALRRAQRALLDGAGGEHADASAPIDPTWSHPYFWAPFVLVGNWL